MTDYPSSRKVCMVGRSATSPPRGGLAVDRREETHGEPPGHTVERASARSRAGGCLELPAPPASPQGRCRHPSVASARVRRRSAATAFTVGCSFPLTGPLASDGAQMKNGVTLAADEINAAGGVAGKKINLSILDTDVTDPAKIKTSLQKHVNDKVDALYEGYLIQWPASMDIKANYGAPSLNASTSIDQVHQIQQQPDKYGNIFQIDPPESYYGLGFPGFLNNVKAAGKWKPAEQPDLHRRGRLGLLADDLEVRAAAGAQAGLEDQGRHEGHRRRRRLVALGQEGQGLQGRRRDGHALRPGRPRQVDEGVGRQPRQGAGLPAVRSVHPGLPDARRQGGERHRLGDGHGRLQRPGRQDLPRRLQGQVRPERRVLELGLGLRRHQHARACLGRHGRRPELQGQHRPAARR